MTIDWNGPAESALDLGTTQTIDGDGQIVLGVAGNSGTIFVNSGTLNLGPSGTITGIGTIGGRGTGDGTDTLVNKGTIRSDTKPTGFLAIGTHDFSNEGVLEAAGPSTSGLLPPRGRSSSAPFNPDFHGPENNQRRQGRIP